ncbi:hypothetical protein PFLUV_G00276600 [Perca fluviatilis]|uniref:Uncharacterized protein n=1 Tax=Perca fluviatilis TaxID=8168 RepID=A0A6A5DN46_PERFL|nr:hypothetical protein PFLUV_G00276600 [Perca fluviatilis]
MRNRTDRASCGLLLTATSGRVREGSSAASRLWTTARRWRRGKGPWRSERGRAVMASHRTPAAAPPPPPTTSWLLSKSR